MPVARAPTAGFRRHTARKGGRRRLQEPSTAATVTRAGAGTPGGVPAPRAAQARVILSPLTLTCAASNGLWAGPSLGAPSAMANLLPWHGQTMRPSLTAPTAQP